LGGTKAERSRNNPKENPHRARVRSLFRVSKAPWEGEFKSIKSKKTVDYKAKLTYNSVVYRTYAKAHERGPFGFSQQVTKGV
jgi:hypothetical protein